MPDLSRGKADSLVRSSIATGSRNDQEESAWHMASGIRVSVACEEVPEGESARSPPRAMGV